MVIVVEVQVREVVLRTPVQQSDGFRGILVAGGRVPRVEQNPYVVAADLIDFSRTGMQVWTDLELTIGEEITATLRDPSRKVELGLGGHVQWQRRIDQRFAVGIQFTAEVSWEIMGELFIRGILDQDSAV